METAAKQDVGGRAEGIFEHCIALLTIIYVEYIRF